MKLLPLALAAALVATAATAAPLTPEQTRAVLARLDASLAAYSLPERTPTIRKMLAENTSRYLALGDSDALAKALSIDLVRASGDKHFAVTGEQPRSGVRRDPRAEAETARAMAYDFIDARHLPGNVGYLKLRMFAHEAEAVEQVAAYMRLLKDTDALIIDLRTNRGGGGPAMDRLLGILLGRATSIQTITWRRPDGSTDVMAEAATAPTPDEAYSRPIYLLVSDRTASAAEAFAYALKAYGRATLVGGTTMGAANPSNGMISLGEGLAAFVPNGLVESAVTHANWEGVGIAPEIATEPKEALVAAYRAALAAARATVEAVGRERNRALANPRAILEAEFAL